VYMDTRAQMKSPERAVKCVPKKDGKVGRLQTREFLNLTAQEVTHVLQTTFMTVENAKLVLRKNQQYGEIYV